ncbi:MAG: EF-hand domain-containing protein [Undibacterium sp.]|uniref:EF-hand domain-containing protein n=1 Tax=Undibacterium sp. TaxID=1914977 RepID=UPI00272801D8|nr:EF-hand domain-containing protein [Undibacterium sp.]MDO8652721.1 EF-hand domain-containing protein [Undibacterium sp.]
MSSIGSISSSSAYSSSVSGVQRQRPDPAKIADSVFSKLDTKGQGYLEAADLESAFSKISSASASTSSTSASADDLFKKLDSNGDGKVTKSEFSTGLKKLSDELDSQFNISRTTDATGTQGTQGTHRPPPPPDGDQDDGVSKDQLTQMASDVSKTNSTAGAALTKVAENFAAADTNQDGKVSMQETIDYLEKSTAASASGAATSSTSSINASASSASTDSSSDANSSSNSSSKTDAAMFKKAMQLLHAYSDSFQLGGTQSAGSSVSVSA